MERCNRLLPGVDFTPYLSMGPERCSFIGHCPCVACGLVASSVLSSADACLKLDGWFMLLELWSSWFKRGHWAIVWQPRLNIFLQLEGWSSCVASGCTQTLKHLYLTHYVEKNLKFMSFNIADNKYIIFLPEIIDSPC